MPEILQLYIRDHGEKTLHLLKYIKQHIDMFKERNVVLKLNLLTDKQISQTFLIKLKKLGISELPALLFEDGVVISSVTSIIDMIQKNVNSAAAASRQAEQLTVGAGETRKPDIMSYNELDQFYRRDMTIKNAMASNKEDDTYGENSKIDMDRRMQEQLSLRAPPTKQPRAIRNQPDEDEEPNLDMAYVRRKIQNGDSQNVRNKYSAMSEGFGSNNTMQNGDENQLDSHMMQKYTQSSARPSANRQYDDDDLRLMSKFDDVMDE